MPLKRLLAANFPHVLSMARRPIVMALALAAAVTSGLAPQMSSNEAMRTALAIADRYRVDAIETRRFTHAEFWAAVQPSLASGALRVTEIGRSVQGRPIRAVTFGRGPVTVLLWSQMHGDESTATMALADIFRFLADSNESALSALRERLRQNLTTVFVPMLNPDGAERFQRQNAVGFDINRDARRIASPEAGALWSVRDSIAPAFGFNLHDQSARTRAGEDGPPVAIALLAPPYDESRGYNEIRSRARLVAAVIAALLAPEIRGRVARYDDTFTPRAFGDLFQQAGTSTVLIESGALPNDPQKQRLRAVTLAAIIGALDAIATAAYREASPGSYEDLPENTGGARDLLIVGGNVVLPGAAPIRADIAVNFDDPVSRSGARIAEVGDLEQAVAIDTVDVARLFLFPTDSTGIMEDGKAWLQIGAPASFDVRRTADPGASVVRRIP